jgi:uncharacterized protein YpbB
VGRSKMNNGFLNYLKFLNGFELTQLKQGLPMLQNFQIKYLIEGFEDKNNFLH